MVPLSPLLGYQVNIDPKNKSAFSLLYNCTILAAPKKTKKKTKMEEEEEERYENASSGFLWFLFLFSVRVFFEIFFGNLMKRKLLFDQIELHVTQLPCFLNMYCFYHCNNAARSSKRMWIRKHEDKGFTRFQIHLSSPI